MTDRITGTTVLGSPPGIHEIDFVFLVLQGKRPWDNNNTAGASAAYRRLGLRRITTQREHLLIYRESLGCDTLQLGSQKANGIAHSFGGQLHAQMPSELTKDVFPAP